MRLRDEVLQILDGNRDWMTDAQLAKTLGKVHQQINRRCRQLAAEGLILRDSGSGVIINRLVRSNEGPPSQYISSSPAVEVVPATPDRLWPREAAVQGALVTWLAGDGWRITRVADTETMGRGTDVIADRDGVRLQVE